MDTAVSVELFVEILNRYVYYFDQQNEAVSSLKILFYKSDLNHDLGYHKIPKRSYRTNPLKSANKSRIRYN